MKPRIAMFGSSLVSAYWNGAATYYRGIIRALHERGYEVTFYEPDAYERQAHRDIPDPEWARVVVYPIDGEAGCGTHSKRRARPTSLSRPAASACSTRCSSPRCSRYKARHALAIFWDVDAPATLDRLEQDPSDPFRRWCRSTTWS